MMKYLFKIISTIIFLNVWASLGAQTFELILDEHTAREIPVELILYKNGDIQLATANSNLRTGNISSSIYIFSKKGVLKRKREFFAKDFLNGLDSSLDFLSINSGIKLSHKILYFSQLRLDTPFTFSKLFFEVDSNLNIINSKLNDTLANERQSYNRIKTFNGKLFASGFNSSLSGLFAQLDSLTDKEIALFNAVDSMYLFDLLDFLVNDQGERYYFGPGAFRPPNFFTSPFQLIKLDSNQQFVKREFLSYPTLPKDIDSLRFRGSINSFWLSDSTFLLTSNGPTTADQKSDIHLFVYDTSFKRLKYKRIISDDSTEYSIFPKTAVYDSICNCFYMGSTKTFNSINESPIGFRDTTDFRLVKFDKNLNIKFNRYYRRDKSMQFWILKTDFEGNVIMAGEIQETNTLDLADSDIFLLKVDSLGEISSPVGLEESDTEINRLNFQFFPNPTNGMVNFRQYNVMEDYRMELYDSQGRLLEQFRLQNSDNSINLTAYPKGVYLYRLIDSQGRRASGKLVRE